MARKHYFSDVQKKEIIERYKNHESRRSISKYFGVTQKVIDRVLKENGLSLVNANKKNNYHESIFEKIDSADKAYWIGFITADGYIHEKRGYLRIKLQNLDRNHLFKFANFIGANKESVKTEFHNITHKPLAKIEISSRKIVDSLIKLNIRQHKSTREKVANIPEEYIRDYLRGLIDGDGSIRPDGSGISLNNSKEVLLFMLNIIIDKFGIAKVKIQNHDHTWKIEYRSKKNVKTILNYLYYDNCTTYLDRKFSLAIAICRPKTRS